MQWHCEMPGASLQLSDSEGTVQHFSSTLVSKVCRAGSCGSVCHKHALGEILWAHPEPVTSFMLLTLHAA